MCGCCVCFFVCVVFVCLKYGAWIPANPVENVILPDFEKTLTNALFLRLLSGVVGRDWLLHVAFGRKTLAPV